MDSYDLKAILGEKLRRLTDKTLKALVDCMCTVGASLCSLDKRVSALESVEFPEGGYKPMQEPVASPSASGTAIQFIESASQDAAGRMTMTKKTVRTGSTSQTGVVQLEDSHSSTSTTKAATPNSVKEAYDLANTANSELANKQDKPSSATENNIATFNGTKSTKDSGKAFLPSTSTWDGTSDDKVPTAKAVQAKLDEKQELLGISQTGNALKFLNEQGSFVESPAMVNVTTFTSYSDISAVISEKSIPYYVHTDTPIVVNLIYAGVSTPTGPGQVAKYLFVGVAGNTVYSTSFSSGASSFGEVYEFPLFGKDYVLGSSDTSSWSTDDLNVPTRAAVEAKIASAISGDIGGLLGGLAVSQINYYIMMGYNFKKGDWFVSSDSGTIYYYPNNDRSQSQQTINVLENQEVYWTSSGHLAARPDLSMNVFSVSNLEDWDTLSSTGVYAIESQSANVANGPGSGSGGRITCYVVKVNGRVIQLAVSTRIWRRQSDNSGGFSNSSWKAFAFTDEIYSLVAKTGTYNESTNPFALKDYVDSSTTNIPKSKLDSYVQASLSRADTALTGDPQGVTSGSGVIQSYRGAIIFVLLVQSDITGVPVISGAAIDRKLCFNIKSFIEYKINAGDRKNHQVYAILNTCGSDVYFTKGTTSGSASSADHVLLKNERFIFVGCYGGSTTLLNSDYYLQ